MFIHAINTWVPPMRYSQQELLQHFGLADNEKARRIFNNTKIKFRHFTAYPSYLLTPQRNPIDLPSLGLIEPDGAPVNLLIEVSNLPEAQFKTPGTPYINLNNHWCPGAIDALELATQSQGKVRIVTFDINSLLRWQPDFRDVNDIVSWALFGDAIAVATVDESIGVATPTIIDFSHHNETAHLVKYENGRLSLNRDLPTAVPQLVERCLTPLFQRYDITIQDIVHWIVHPAGRKVLDNIEGRFNINLSNSRVILRNFGNVGASSVFFVLKKIMAEENPQPGDYGVILSFGPGKNSGFVVAACLLQWQ